MPITPWVPTVTRIQNGEDVSAEVVNPISAQHTQRAQHLYEKFNELSGKSVLIAFDQPLLPSTVDDVRKNLVVFYDKEGTEESATEGLSPALVAFSSDSFSSAYTPSNSSYAVGIIKEVNDDVADVYLWGLVELDNDIDDEDWGLIQSDEIDLDAEFEPGPLYLSRTEAGKLTRTPAGVAIYVGYAFNRRTLLLAPNVSEFNQFFTTYKFNILDRPAGVPVLTGSTWDLTGVSLVGGDGGINHTGWIPVDALVGGPLESLTPEGAKFFYNLPAEDLILADTGVDSDLVLRNEQKELSRQLPPNPTNVTLLTVNGVIQPSRDNETDGIYIVNTAGIWWFDDQDGQQPWASDIPVEVNVTFDHTLNEITVPDGAFEVDDVVRFTLAGGATIPTGLAINTSYYVIDIDTVGDDQVIKISATEGGAELDFTSNGSGTISIPQLYIWKFSQGTDEYRPRISLQFLKFNPALRESIVTSVKKYNTGSNILRFYKPDKSEESSTGDLLARVVLDITDGTAEDSAATAITDLTYDETTGQIEKTTAPIVSELIAGSGISITARTVGGETLPGSYIISSSVNSQAGRVSYIEPDGAELLYAGLHSYLNMPPASELPSSLTGKILLPTGIPDADMYLVVILLGDSTLALAAANKVVEYDFSYSVTKAGSVLDTTISPTTITFNIPNSTAQYTAKTVFKVGAVTAATYSIPLTDLKVPANVFRGGDCSVNFRLTRKTPSSNAYTGDIGVVDVYWKIG
jgi:hypothetical protein